MMTRSIGARIAALAVVNLLLIAGIGVVATGVRLPRSLGEAVVQASGPHLTDVSRRVALDVVRTPRADADAVLQRYEQEYGAIFRLVTNDGQFVGGAAMSLPATVLAALNGSRPAGRPPEAAGALPHRLPPGPSHEAGGLQFPSAPPFVVSTSGRPSTWVGVRIPIRFASDAAIVPGTLLMGFDSLWARTLFPWSWVVWATLGLALTLACWWPFLRGLAFSLGRMERATRRIAEGHFETSLGVTRRDEIGRLASSIEHMAARLRSMVSGQKRFLGDTAHELGSPIGRMRVALELLKARVPESERAYVADIEEDVDTLGSLTRELLEYARAELVQTPPEMSDVALGELVERVVAAESGSASIAVQVPEGLTVRANARLLERALANVVRNAVGHGEGGGVRIEASRRGDRVDIAIADEGPGVPPESLDRVFEPFYREDRARGRTTGGSGLGLAIVKSAVDACGGTVGCRNRSPHGLEVTLVLQAG